jgi:DNA-binding MarR family transcriptional regulator
MRTFSIDAFVESLRRILQEFAITGVYVFIDDFSEIDAPSAAVLMSEIIYPLEVAADELFTFKIAVYPGEYRIEPLERARIDILYLDPYQMYSRRTGPAMEAAATEYVGRLLRKRFDYFCGSGSIDRYFAAEMPEVYRLLFEASFCNPRAMGWLLSFAVEDRLERNKPLTLADLKNGARKYFERLLAPKISDRRIFSAVAEERDRIFVAKALLNAFVDEARRLRNYKDSAFFSAVSGANPTSHFYCFADCEKHLQFLLDQQVIHFYRYASDKSAKDIGVFALDYGLCESEGILYGRTGVGQVDKDYFVQRVFNYSDKINTLCGSLEVFCCDKCSATEGLHAEHALAMIRFLCPHCRAGTMRKELRNLPDPALAKAEATPKLSNDEFNVLSMLAKAGGKKLSAKEIAPAIDINSIHVGQLARRLVDQGYVDRSRAIAGRPYQYVITAKAKQQFFAESEATVN